MYQAGDGPKALSTIVLITLGTTIVAAVLTTLSLVAIDRFDRPGIEMGVSVPPTIVVEVGGAVATPGVYQLPGDARLHDAIDAAGGLSRDADRSALNLAARLGDGESVSIPSTAGTTVVTATAPAQRSVVNINTATLEQLDTLPGIGPVIGERIIVYREEHGPFDSVDTLTNVDGISENLLARLRPYITVDD